MTEWLAEFIRVFLIWTLALIATAMPFAIAIFTPWRKSVLGWSIMAHAIGFALLLDMTIFLRRVKLPLIAVEIVTIFVFALLLAFMVIQLGCILIPRIRNQFIARRVRK